MVMGYSARWGGGGGGRGEEVGNQKIVQNWTGCPCIWAYGVVVSMFDFHRSDQGSNPSRGGKIS